ncbi:hypothetical protein TNCV_2584361 [Trichonephila clavipes]|nr:hypothetical protein TNCV_2584361 [Trichonephila clavipes]
MKRFNQTPYKLPPPTPIHVPAEKRPLEEKSLPKKRVRITPVMRRVSRRSERPMAPVQIHNHLCRFQICPTITCAYSTTTCADSRRCPPSPVHIPQPAVQIPDVLEPPVQIPDVLEPVQIPMSQVPQPPMQILPEPMNILHVSEPVQIPDDPEPVQIPVSKSTATYADSPRTYEHSTCSTTCADSVSQVPQPPMQILPEPMNILHVSEPVQIPVSQVPQPPMQILHVSEPVQIPVSQVLQSPVQIPPVQLLPELDILDPLESTDAFDQLMSFVFGPQNSSCFTRYPLFLMEISSISWMNLKESLWT